ncbi:MAG: 2-dehydropantoate 2-reductase [bacterium ADurb.Bin236]|nr:MAG: 2-dehydropantoate 2-reductase [bacterium ADurb.Bin236]HOY62597.1 2-dehydropantoate 2-reductase [bacterium]HPN94770.1 2-dehydropantoate 2-reductase [bacterium]
MMKLVFFGAGAVGASVGGWIAEKHEEVYFVDKPEIVDRLREDGVTFYQQGEEKRAVNVKVKAACDISEIEDPDVVVVSVKNYSLDPVARMLKDKVGDLPIIVALQNGVENQKILPKYFSRVLYGVICYNAWLDKPGTVGFQKRGPIVLGALDDEMKFEAKMVARVFNKGVETIVTPHIQDAAHSKIIINLTNSLTTLVGHKFREISDPALFQKLLTNLTYEGVRVVKAAGYGECKLGGMPSWMVMEMATKLPPFISKPIFDKNVKKMVVSSMAQDIIQRGGGDSELDTINGRIIELADQFGVDIPYNRAVFKMCKAEFAKPKFEPLDVRDVWAEVSKNIR